MKTTWIVTSAIFSNVGVYSPEIRILQTHETINSILKQYSDAKIILVEAGNAVPADHEMYNQLKARCHVYLNLTGNEQIEHLQNKFFNVIQNRNEMGGATGLSKTVAELTLMNTVLAAMIENDQVKPAVDVDRIFKISGRYQLSPLFDPAVYESPLVKDKYVFKTRDFSWIPNAADVIGTDHGFSSRLWSFDASLLNDIKSRFESMIEDCLQISDKHYIDIEHLLYKHMELDKVVEFDHTHLYGTIAPNGTLIYD